MAFTPKVVEMKTRWALKLLDKGSKGSLKGCRETLLELLAISVATISGVNEPSSRGRKEVK